MSTPREERPPESLNPLQPEELEDYAQLRKLISPSVSLELLDNFAKWLFTLTGVVAALGAGLSVTGANHLSHDGQRLFAIAIALVALSLALAALARLPLPVSGGRYSRVAMERGLRRLLWVRFVLLTIAALLFAAGLALAGWAQVS
jgi:ABC-type dipeptide/oligopeptide/nickel transport system ATPase subunit